MISAPSFYRNLGLAGGSLWLVAVGAVYIAWALIAIRSAPAMMMLAVLAVPAIALIAFGIKLIRTVRLLPHGPVDDPSRRRRIGRQFGMILAAETAGCAVVATVCTSTHHWKLIVPLIVVVVGLHFLPLARLFQVPRYYLLGALFCIIPLTTLLTVSSSAHIGHAISWIAISAIGCGLVSLATGAAGLDEVQRFLNSTQGPLPAWDSQPRSA